CADDFARVKRETGDIAVGFADLLPPSIPEDRAANGAGCVLDHRNAVLSDDSDHASHVARHAHLVHAQDRSGPFCDGGLDQCGVDIDRAAFDVHEHRQGAAVTYGIRGRDVRVTDGDDFVAWTDTGH